MIDQVDHRKLDDGLARIFGIGPQEAGVNLDAIRAKAASNLAAYGKLLAELFARHAIELPPAVHLQWWPEGSRIRVAGEHASKERIEVMLNGDGELVEEFKELELLHEIVRSTELAGVDDGSEQHFNIGITSSGPIAFFSA
ncbi:hypothetical protein [Chitinimonas sp.]|uniref:hypothetical protein n=1 Tax=Chitinimonas sp. TaxID=1934313 RepID=UPI0035AE4472